MSNVRRGPVLDAAPVIIDDGSYHPPLSTVAPRIASSSSSSNWMSSIDDDLLDRVRYGGR